MKPVRKIILLLLVCCSVIYIGTRHAEGEIHSRETAAFTDPNPMKVNPFQKTPPGEPAYYARGD